MAAYGELSDSELFEELEILSEMADTVANVFTDEGISVPACNMAAAMLRHGANVIEEIGKRAS
jgi:hypothetical protein